MRWPMAAEPICTGTNKNNTMKEAMKILKAEHGTGDVNRFGAMCSVPLQYDDIEMEKIPFLNSSRSVTKVTN